MSANIAPACNPPNPFLRTFGCVLVIGLLSLISACKEATFSVPLRSYNHMSRTSVHYVTVNEGMGPNAMPGGGGGGSCCVSLPKTWRKGLKAKVSWTYDKFEDDPSPVPPSQTVEIEVPEYKKMGSLHVHFYENHRIKIVVSNCSPGHPFYPLSDKDRLPWVPSGTKEYGLKYQNYGKHNEC